MNKDHLLTIFNNLYAVDGEPYTTNSRVLIIDGT